MPHTPCAWRRLVVYAHLAFFTDLSGHQIQAVALTSKQKGPAILSQQKTSAGEGPSLPPAAGSQVQVYEEAVEWPEANLKPLQEQHRRQHARAFDVRAGVVGDFRMWFAIAYAVVVLVMCTHRRYSCANPDGAEAKLVAGHTGAPAQVGYASHVAPEVGQDGVAWEALAKCGALVGLWMAVSVSLIIFNKWLFTNGEFPYPLTLAAMHMGCCFIVFGAISWLPAPYRRCVMPDVDKEIPIWPYLKASLPVALLYALGVGFGDLGFLYASVSFNLFVKPSNVVFTTLAAFAFGLEVCTSTHVFIVFLVASGVATAAAAGLEFSMAGLGCQLIATATEGVRLVLIQRVCQRGMKLDPITTLYHFAPFTGFLLCGLAFAFDGPVDLTRVTSPGLLALNCGLAVVLNVLIVGTIARTSAMVFVMCGVIKDITTIVISALAFHVSITHLEMAGYGMSLIGIGTYKVYKNNLEVFVERGFFGGFGHVLFGCKSF